MPVDWHQFRKARIATNSMFLTLEREELAEPVWSEKPRQSLRDSLLALDTDQRRAFIAAQVLKVLALVLRLSPERIGMQTPLGALGMESLAAVEFRNRLEANLDLKLSATLVWNYPTVDAIATYLAGRLGIDIETSSTARTPALKIGAESAAVGIAMKVQHMTDDEAMRALLSRPKENK